ncbi:PAS domain-containing sensor histidine kinase [Devosia insulae DS-56]|uniref:histidine kinase n=2 Tax=Devosia insulae TaxID=408174 RepID=A0A1E5XIV6_9HYPH|nr:PAS domain-containing sensor histidine kinase [Devosia insulae DS-56]
MEITSSLVRRNLAIAIALLGMVLALLTAEPSGLMVSVAAIAICFGWKPGLAATLAAGPLGYGVLAVRDRLADAPMELTVLVVAAFGIWLLVWIFRTASFHERVHQSARQIIEDLPGLGWSADPNGHIRFFNPAGLERVGMTAEEMQKQMEEDDYAWRHTIHPEDAERSAERFRHSIRTGEPMHDEARVRHHDGTYRWFRDIAVPARDETGRITGWFGTTVDIDDQKRAEEALHHRERELRLMVDTVPTMIFLMTPQGLPYYFNKRFVDWAGIDPGDETQGNAADLNTHAELIHPDDRNDVAAAFARSFGSGEPLFYKGRLKRRDGQYRWLDSRVEPLRDDSGAIIRWYGVNIDIDDEVRAQEALRLADERLARASRAASLSELSVSIAHELNSPLQAVVANANAFQRWLGATPPNYERAGRTAERIIRDANAAAEVITRIRALFAQTGQDRNPVDLNLVITEVCELVSDKLTSGNVRLELELDAALPAVPADRVQLEQVILNLVRNGIEAMTDVPASARRLRILSRRTGGMAEIEVEDQGPGIADAERIFDAFYTTKRDGMGMGLSICRSIVEAHEGRIGARSAPGEGTSVAFSLPLQLANG